MSLFSRFFLILLQTLFSGAAMEKNWPHAPKIVRRTTMGPYVVPSRKRSSAAPSGMEESKKAKYPYSPGKDYVPSWQYSPTNQSTSYVTKRSSLPSAHPFKQFDIKESSLPRRINRPLYADNEVKKENLRSRITASSSLWPKGDTTNRVRLTRCSTLPVFNSNAHKASKLSSFLGVAAVVATDQCGKRIAVLVPSNQCSPPVTPIGRLSATRVRCPPAVRRLTSTLSTVNEPLSTLVAEETYDYSMHDFGTQPREIWSTDSLLTSSSHIGVMDKTGSSNSALRRLLNNPNDCNTEPCHSAILKQVRANSGQETKQGNESLLLESTFPSSSMDLS